MLVRPNSSMIGYSDGQAVTWYQSYNKASFLLCGFALENLLKAFLVYENPHWISNGRLAKNLKSHELTKLQGQSKLVPYKNRLIWVLEEFENGLESWARYPCALVAEETIPSRQMTPELWNGYLKLSASYRNKLRLLLSQMWNGPHGACSRAVFQGKGETLGRQGFRRLRSSSKI